MTVKSKLKKALTQAEGLKSEYETFAMDTDDQMAQKMFNDFAQAIDIQINQLKDRLNYVKEEEPQYRSN